MHKVILFDYKEMKSWNFHVNQWNQKIYCGNPDP